MKKKLFQMGIDPVTHRPRVDLFSAMPQLIALAGLNDIMGTQLDQLAKLQSFNSYLNIQPFTANSMNNPLNNPIDLWSNSIRSLASNFSLVDVGNTEQPNENKICENVVSASLVNSHNLMNSSASNGDACSSASYEKSVVSSSIWPDNFSEQNFLSNYASLQ
ncbi:hypothetical protein FCM35_KLT14945 [Carex littledalei]|uniref:Uncharacterized protein n=1 Tax=Carex littledalei TaxID=544730 RepID=A0A833QIL7_9POAL|nr:hypothetical protein FCM35_KLT14945 [Carex littledalei]